MESAGIDRRTFLASSAGVAAGLAVQGCTSEGGRGDSASAPVTDPDELQDWDVVREQFELDPDLAHFAAFVLAAHPASVRLAIERWRTALDTDPAEVLRHERDNEEAVRAAAGRPPTTSTPPTRRCGCAPHAPVPRSRGSPCTRTRRRRPPGRW